MQMKLWQSIQKLAWARIAGAMFFVAVVVGIGLSMQHGMDWLAKDKAAPIARIHVSGEQRFVSAQEIAGLVLKGRSHNFFQLNVEEVQQLLADVDWIDSASVQKRWPNELYIHVTEQQPVATWNGDMLINQRGELFVADLNKVKQALPAFFGPAGSEQEVLAEFASLGELLATSSLLIDEMVLSERYAWQLQLDNAVRVNLGQEDRVQRLHRFLTLLPTMEASEQGKIDYVDLRYDTGMAVGWKPENENENA